MNQRNGSDYYPMPRWDDERQIRPVGRKKPAWEKNPPRWILNISNFN